MLLLRDVNSAPMNNWRVMPAWRRVIWPKSLSQPLGPGACYAQPRVRVGPALHLIILFLRIHFFKLIKLCIFKFL